MTSILVKFHVPRKVFRAIQISLAIGFSLKQLVQSQVHVFREIAVQVGSSGNNTDATANPTLSGIENFNHTTSHQFTNHVTVHSGAPKQNWPSLHVKNNTSLSQANFSCDIVDGNLTWNGPVFPHLMIVGAAKAGTTAINHFLSQVPNFLRTVRPEPHFWDFKVRHSQVPMVTPPARCQLIKQYRGYWDARLIGLNTFVYEKTPSLLSIPKSPKSIRTILNPHIPKILIVLRDPIERFYSHYKMSFQRKLLNDSSVEDVVIKDVEKLIQWSILDVPAFSGEKPQQKWNQSHFVIMPDNVLERNLRSSLVARGMYAPQVAAYMRYFPLGTSLKVIEYENFTKNKRSSMLEILDWLGVPSHNWTDEDLEDDHGPVQISVPIPVMSDEMKSYLQHLYKPFNDKLADLLGENWRGVWEVDR